ncbi:MAG: hypothetical protein QM530_00760 [Phycisphaerales bacterium]|nr:hypothetical protein [Phycisphaerales bacterium]
MKKTSFIVLAIGLLILSALSSCKKEEVKKVPLTANKSNISNLAKKGGVWYGSYSCETEAGKEGCECVITTDEETCSMPKDCGSSFFYPTYNTLLHTLYTPTQIAIMCQQGDPITNPALLNALLADGFPAIVPQP